jgi:acetyl-CoA/propionyl-CoA carboxylase biotin carboxyl carrier protein
VEDEFDAAAFSVEGTGIAGDAPIAASASTGDGATDAAALIERTVPVEVDGKRFSVRLWLPDAPGGGGETARRTPRPRPAAAGSAGGAGDGVISAPMQGTIVKVLVAEGDEVESGQALLVLEAMKMENHINALGAGTIKEIRVGAGDTVGTGDVLLVIG